VRIGGNNRTSLRAQRACDRRAGRERKPTRKPRRLAASARRTSRCEGKASRLSMNHNRLLTRPKR
jgi:hypothetical protein